MLNARLCFLIPLLLACILLSNHPVKCDEEDDLLRGINVHRTSLNLTALMKNDDAECLAEEIADKFKNQPCTNTTGSNTIPGTEPNYPDFPSLLDKCHLNISNPWDGEIMPACVPNLVPSIVLSNFTHSQYSGKLNDSKYSGIGIGSEDNWIVVVLTTNTTGGSFVPAPKNSATMVSEIGLISHLLFFMMVSALLL